MAAQPRKYPARFRVKELRRAYQAMANVAPVDRIEVDPTSGKISVFLVKDPDPSRKMEPGEQVPAA
jgi:hypothetical protein